MYRIPKWWRKFKMQMTIQDLNMGRKNLIKTTDDEGNEHLSIEAVATELQKSLDKPASA